MFADFHWTRAGRWLAVVLIVLAIVGYVAAGLAFSNAWPSSYVWSELLISYEGGFVRRGLLGEIAYLLHPVVSAQALLTTLFVVLYIAVAVRVIVLACANLSFASLLFALSPAALLFPLNDPGAFGRKDLIILAAFLLALAVVRRVASPTLAFALIVLAYVPVGLIHEAGLLYFPLAVAFLLHTSGRHRSRRWVGGILAASAAFLLLAVALSVVFHGNEALEAKMVAAWQAREPGIFSPLYAAGYLSEGFQRMLETVLLQTVAYVTLAGYLICAFLGGVPVAAYAIERPPALSPDPLRRRVLQGAVAAMLVSFVIAADWGRFIHLFWMHAFVFLASISSTPTAPPAPMPTWRSDPRRLLFALALVLLYVLTWRMANSVVRANPFWPGYIFRIQPFWRFAFDQSYPLEPWQTF